ncbi:MAG: protease complex subunit PrcB family protein [Bacteroidetes bacterium]|nr:protease complex subunit PrcB family protein [Bacteroidota bacterium]
MTKINKQISKQFLLLLSVILISCTSTKKVATNSSITFKTIDKNTNGGFQELTQEVYTNHTAFEKAWKLAWSNFSDPTPAPIVDFNNDVVVLVALGMRKNGGYQLKINSVSEEANEIMVDYTETTPNPKCTYSQSIIFPYEFISFSKTSKKVVFKSSSNVGECR